eukprot:8466856-Ditylum_brightwellii.AAC.2
MCRHKGILGSKEMRGMFVLLGKDNSKVKAASNMMDSDNASLDRFTDIIFTNLNMLETFGGQVGLPVNTGADVINDGDSIWNAIRFELEFIKNMGDLLEGFNAFISSINFCCT